MLISHSWYSFNLESAYKKPSFILFFSDVVLRSNYQIWKAEGRQ